MTVAATNVSLNVGTVAMWFQSDIDETSTTPFYWFDTDSARHAFYHNNNGSSKIQMYNDGRSTDFDVAWTTTAWHHVIFMYNKTGNVQRVWLDGVEGTGTTPGGTWGSTALGTNAYLALRFSLTQIYNGRLAHIHVYNRVIGDWEVNQLRFFPPSVPDGMLVYLPTFGTASPEEDLSGRGATATVTGPPDAFADGPPILMTAGVGL